MKPLPPAPRTGSALIDSSQRPSALRRAFDALALPLGLCFFSLLCCVLSRALYSALYSALCVGFCVAQPTPTPPPAQSASASARAPQRDTKQRAERAEGAEQEQGVLSREELSRHLARGPQPLVASVRVTPAFKKGRFHGFKLAMIASGSPAERGGLRVGDVLIAINGQAIGTPSEVMKVWEGLAQAERLSVRFERAEQVMSYTWRLE